MSSASLNSGKVSLPGGDSGIMLQEINQEIPADRQWPACQWGRLIIGQVVKRIVMVSDDGVGTSDRYFPFSYQPIGRGNQRR